MEMRTLVESELACIGGAGEGENCVGDDVTVRDVGQAVGVAWAIVCNFVEAVGSQTMMH